MKSKIASPFRLLGSGHEYQKTIKRMSKKFIIFLIFMPQLFYGQWVVVGPAVGQMTDIYCINENIVVTVGDNGTITKTIDGGTTWVQKNFNTTYNLMKVQFGSANVGYAIGFYTNSSQGILLKTINGGENWTVLNINLPDILFINDISVINENILYLTAYGNSFSGLIKTVDGGNNFTITYTGNDLYPNIQFISDLVGYFPGNNGLKKTIDGGTTWNLINNLDIYDFQFINENVGFFRGGPGYGLYKTIDGGATYDYLTYTTTNLGKMYASSENVVWGITFIHVLNGQPEYTTRGETLANGSFNRIDVASPLFRAMHFANPMAGYALGINDSVIYKNITGELLSTNRVELNTIPKIYPNPATDKINVSFDATAPKSFNITLVDVLGKKIFSQTYENQSNISINTLNFYKGIYFLSIITPDGTTTKKIIIN